ncbi:MAG: branched-chain amino acid ABC transporter ATP-binding protein/permease [Rhodomicrobium sp.]
MPVRSIFTRTWVPDLLTAAVLAAAPFVLPHIGFVPETMSRVLVWGLFGIGFDLLFGYTGLLSFGQAAFFGTGGFVAAYLLTAMGFSNAVLGLLIGMAAAAAAGALVGLIALRRTGIYFTMITVAIAEVFFFIENSPLSNYTGGENGLPGVPAPVFNLGFTTIKADGTWPMYTFMAVCYMAGIMIARRIVRSPAGRILVAIRDNPIRAAATGHNIHHYKLLVFVIAAAYAGFAGGLLGILQGYMPPDAFAFDTSGQVVIQTVIGGPGTIIGPLAGAALWLYLQDFLQGPLGLGASWKLALGIVFVLLVCFLRRGIVGAVRYAFALAFKKGQSPEARDEPHGPIIAPEEKMNGAVSPMPAVARAASPGSPVLEAKHVSKRYGGLTANQDINFSVARGELRAVIGPNGAGKSTFFKMLTCEVKPTSGRIVFEGRDITGLSVTRVCQLGLTKSYQVNQLFTGLTVRENLTIAALAKGRGSFRADLLRSPSRVAGLEERVAQTLELIRLSERADAPAASLAYGEKRRLEIGLALGSSPSLLLLDEPLAGMSPRERKETVELIKAIRRGRTLVVIEHDTDAIFELAETITVLHEGRILVQGPPKQVQGNSLVQEAYLGGITPA